jgi:hypothetical protein
MGLEIRNVFAQAPRLFNVIKKPKASIRRSARTRVMSCVNTQSSVVYHTRQLQGSEARQRELLLDNHPVPFHRPVATIPPHLDKQHVGQGSHAMLRNKGSPHPATNVAVAFHIVFLVGRTAKQIQIRNRMLTFRVKYQRQQMQKLTLKHNPKLATVTTLRSLLQQETENTIWVRSYLRKLPKKNPCPWRTSQPLAFQLAELHQ